MRAVVQRVTSASVSIDGRRVAEIGRGLLVLVGVEDGDGVIDVEYIATKTRQMRVFEDAAGKMNLSVESVDGAVLVVSQFTVCGDCRKGRRPSFDAAAPPEAAIPLYEALVKALRVAGVPVQTGEFQADMAVSLVNDGPVTLLLDSRRRW